MDKYGSIDPRWTPPADKDKQIKSAETTKPEDLEDHLTKRISDKAAEALKTTQKHGS